MTEYNQLSLKDSLYLAIPTSYETERFVLVGEGVPYDDCGQTKMVLKCPYPDCDYPIELIPHDCKRPECPICNTSWKRRASKRATEKIMNCLELAKQHINSGYSLSSVVISLPKDTPRDYDLIKQEFRKAHKYLGTNHIAAVLHLERFRDHEGNEVEYNTYKIAPHKYVREWGPHFHCIIMGRLAVSSKFFSKSGMIYKKLGGFLKEWDVYDIIYYALSHASVSLDKQRKMIDYYGLIRRTRIEEEIVELEPDLCPNCDSQLETITPYPWINVTYLSIACGEEILGIHEPHYRRVVTRKWAIAPRNNTRPRL